MKFLRYIYSATIVAALGATVSGCDKDGDIIYTNGVDTAELEGNTADIVLDKDYLDALVLTVYWNANGDISLSNPAVAAPSGAVTNVLQYSADNSFTNPAEETIGQGIYERQLTCRDLNSIVSRLGFDGDVKSTLYIRVKSSLGSNLDPVTGNVLAVNVTPYAIDMTTAFYLNSSQEATGRTLYSPAADGRYTGFIGAGGWENWWLREGNNTIWGNDGVTGTAFVMGNNTTGEDVWNFWYPGQAGCYYTVVDTHANEWSATYIPELTLDGDLNGSMTYDRRSNQWIYTYDAVSAGTVNITISGNGKLYNASTGTDDSNAIDTPVAFGGNATGLTFGQSGSSIAVEIPSAGETTLILDLNDPTSYRIAAGEGPAEPAPAASEKLYLSGVYGEWTFDWYVKLYNEDNLNYGGALPVDSEWGYKIYTEADNWDNFYTMAAGGNAYEGALTLGGEGNIYAPAPGFYLFDISLSGMSYKLTSISKVSYTGLNDDWNLYEMTPAEAPGVYTATVTKSANTPWGVKIVLNDDWNLFFGGNGTPGELALYQDGFEGDNELENGTYTLTVDLAKGTYSYTK